MGFYLVIDDFDVPALMIMNHQFPGAYRRVEYRGEQSSRPKAWNLILDNPNGNIDALVSDGRQIAPVG